MPKSYGLPLLSDFGETRFNHEAGKPGENIMPDIYKAPEVIFHMEWDYKVDVWNMAMVVSHGSLCLVFCFLLSTTRLDIFLIISP